MADPKRHDSLFTLLYCRSYLSLCSLHFALCSVLETFYPASIQTFLLLTEFADPLTTLTPSHVPIPLCSPSFLDLVVCLVHVEPDVLHEKAVILMLQLFLPPPSLSVSIPYPTLSSQLYICPYPHPFSTAPLALQHPLPPYFLPA